MYAMILDSRIWAKILMARTPGRTMICLAVVACLSRQLAAADPADLPLITLSAEGAEQHVAASSDQVTSRAAADSAAGALDVTILPGKEGYPGITIKPKDTAWDLSRFGHIDLRLRNTGDKPIVVSLRADGDLNWKLSPWNVENAELRPGASDTIRVRFGYSWGKRGYAIDPAKVVQVLVFLGKSDSTQSFRVESIEAGGSPGEKPAVPPEPVHTKPKDGILLGAGTSVNGAKQLDRAAQATLALGQGRSVAEHINGQGDQTSVRLKPAVGRWDLSAYEPGHRSRPQRRAGADHASSTRGKWRWRLRVGGCRGTGGPGRRSRRSRSPLPGPRSGTVSPSPARKSTATRSQPSRSRSAGRTPGGKYWSIRSAPCSRRRASPRLARQTAAGRRQVGQTLNDNFDGNSIDSSHWDIYGEDYWDKQSHFGKANVIVGDGVVKLRFEKEAGHQNDNPDGKETDYATGFLTPSANGRSATATSKPE